MNTNEDVSEVFHISFKNADTSASWQYATSFHIHLRAGPTLLLNPLINAPSWKSKPNPGCLLWNPGWSFWLVQAPSALLTDLSVVMIEQYKCGRLGLSSLTYYLLGGPCEQWSTQNNNRLSPCVDVNQQNTLKWQRPSGQDACVGSPVRYRYLQMYQRL